MPDTLKLNRILEKLDDMKAENVATIALAGKTSIADYMIVASGRANRHVAALADIVIDDLKQNGDKPLAVAGQESADWIVVDANDIIVHLFRPEVRDFYQLEKMWQEL